MAASDLVVLREAAQSVGRSMDTLKRWIRAGKLQAHRQGREQNAPILVSRGEVVTLAARMAERPEHVSSVVQPRTRRASAEEDALARALTAHLADVQQERDRLAQTLAEERAVLAGLRVELTEARQRLAAVESELRPGGVRGLLRRWL